MDVDTILANIISGNTSILSNMYSFEIRSLFKCINLLHLDDTVIEKLFKNLKDKYPTYTFMLVYDREEYREFCLKVLEEDFSILFIDNLFLDFLGKTKWSIEYIKRNYIILTYFKNEAIYYMIRYAINYSDFDFINEICNTEDLFIRGLAMVEIADNYPYYFNRFFSDIINSIVKKDSDGSIIEVLDESLVSKIAYLIVENNIGLDLFYKLKEFIFSNYESNTLARLLDKGLNSFEYGDGYGNYSFLIEEDMTRFFITSKDYKYELYKNKTEYIDKKLWDDFDRKIRFFANIDEEIIEHIFRCGLGNKFLEYVDKYLEMSTGSKVVSALGNRGSTTRSFRIGDYVIKCSDRKWNISDLPISLFLFAKCYERDYAKDKFGKVVGALEVQKYYSKAVTSDDAEVVKVFRKALEELGYWIKDRVEGFNETYNMFYLDSYLDADCENPELLPKWFKENPVVWVDLDLVFKIK